MVIGVAIRGHSVCKYNYATSLYCQAILLRHDRVFIAKKHPTNVNASVNTANRLRHIYLYICGVISFTRSTQSPLHRSFSTRSTNLSKSSNRKKHLPPAIATNGSSAATVVQHAGMDQHSRGVVEVDPVLAPVVAIRNQLELLASQGMVRVVYLEVGIGKVTRRRSCRPPPTRLASHL